MRIEYLTQANGISNTTTVFDFQKWQERLQ